MILVPEQMNSLNARRRIWIPVQIWGDYKRNILCRAPNESAKTKCEFRRFRANGFRRDWCGRLAIGYQAPRLRVFGRLPWNAEPGSGEHDEVAGVSESTRFPAHMERGWLAGGLPLHQVRRAGQHPQVANSANSACGNCADSASVVMTKYHTGKFVQWSVEGGRLFWQLKR